LQEQFEDFNDFDIDGGTDSETRYGTYCALQKRSAAKKNKFSGCRRLYSPKENAENG